MSFLKNNKIYIIFIYVNIMFILTLAKVCYKINNFNYMYISLLFFIGVLFYWFYNSALKKKSFRIIFTIFLLGICAVLYFLNPIFFQGFIQNYILDKFSYINSLVAQSKDTNFNDYKYIFIITIPLSTFILTFLSNKGEANSVLIFNFCLITALWYFGYVQEIKRYLFYYVLISSITYSINSFAKNTRKLSKKGMNISIKGGKIFIYSVIISLVIAQISDILPQEYNGRYTSEMGSRIYNRFAKPVETGEAKGKKYKYDLTFSGYSENNKKLGGPVTINNVIAFKVKSDDAYYLKGNVKNYYDGFSWSEKEKKYTKQKDKAESMLLESISNHFINKSESINIYPEELNTSTIFAPNLTYNASLKKGDIYYDEIPTFISNEVISKPYTIYFYSTYKPAEEILKIYGDKNNVSQYYYEQNYGNYLQVPDNISYRVRLLVNDITKDYKSSYEKVQAIKSYLSKNYKYTLEVPEVPEGKEFLDYFLFTEKKGYCTYFATAETIMCRIAGVPARYVEGFNMTKEKDKNFLYIVRNEDAHAWTEVLYLSSPDNGFWYTVDAVSNAAEINREQNKYEDIKNPSSTKNAAGVNINPFKRPSAAANKNNEISESKTNNMPQSILKIIYIVLALVLIAALPIILFLIRKKNMLKSKSIIPLYNYSLYRLQSIGIKRNESFSDFEFIEKMEKRLSSMVKAAAFSAYKEYFGEKNPAYFDKLKYYDFIESFIKERQTKVRYFIRKYYFFEKSSFIKIKIMILYNKLKSIRF